MVDQEYSLSNAQIILIDCPHVRINRHLDPSSHFQPDVVLIRPLSREMVALLTFRPSLPKDELGHMKENANSLANRNVRFNFPL